MLLCVNIRKATPNSAVGTQSFTSKDISDIRNDYLQKQSELQPIKPQSPFKRFETNSVDKETIGLSEMRQNESKSHDFIDLLWLKLNSELPIITMC